MKNGGKKSTRWCCSPTRSDGVIPSNIFIILSRSVNLIQVHRSYLFIWNTSRPNFPLFTRETSRNFQNSHIILKCGRVVFRMVDNFTNGKSFFICINSIQFPCTTGNFFTIWSTRRKYMKQTEVLISNERSLPIISLEAVSSRDNNERVTTNDSSSTAIKWSIIVLNHTLPWQLILRSFHTSNNPHIGCSTS